MFDGRPGQMGCHKGHEHLTGKEEKEGTGRDEWKWQGRDDR